MENNDQPINPPAFPTASDLRAQAREALRGNWKKALGSAAIACLIVSLISLILNIANDLFVINEFRNNPSLAYGEVPRSYLLEIITILVNILISPLYTLPIARIARAVVVGDSPEYEMLRVSRGELFKAIRIELVVAWRSIYIPTLIWMIPAIVGVVLMRALNVSREAALLFLILSMIVLCVVFTMRTLYYTPIYQMMLIHPEDSARTLANRSRDIMKGNRKRLFFMELSFFGWMFPLVALLRLMQNVLADQNVVFSMFVFVYDFLMLPLTLYIQTALAAFTKDLLERG